MSGRGGQVDERIGRTVAYLLVGARFTLDESANWTKQMAVRLLLAKETGSKSIA